MKKKLLSLTLAGLLALSMTACSGNQGGSGTAATDTTTTSGSAADNSTADTAAAAADSGAAGGDETVYKIGVLQFVQHTALDAANQGFIDALNNSGIKYEIDQQNASGEQSNCVLIAEKLVGDKSDLILAIATPAAQAVAGVTEDIPILITAVTDPETVGLVNSNENPGVNVSGTSDLTPVKKQMELLSELLPEAKTVGLLYCSAEINSEIQAQIARETLEEKGIAYKDYTVSQLADIQTVVESMVGKVDVIYAPTDNMIASGMATVGMIALENNIPIICGEEGMTLEGGLATYGIDYYQLGYLTGEQAVEILTEGTDVKTMPIAYYPDEKCELTVNEEVAAALGIDTSILKK